LFILNRETGSPITNAKVQIWKNHYDYEKGKYEMKKVKLYFYVNDGSIDLIADSSHNDFEYIEVIHQGDRLMTASPLQLYRWNGYENKMQTGITYRNTFFTDRAIYRPGQVVEFKGILTATNNDKNQKLSVDQQAQVFLYNANNQAIDSLITKTNNYGSYNGRFTIPQGELPGNYRLTCRNVEGETYFMVEEYKRPKFLVKVDPPLKAYQVHDTITVKGEVLSYSGFAISNAQISYRIVRKPNLPYPWLCYRWGWPLMSEKEIISGNTTADKNGIFLINFPALPDLSIRKELNPLFNYEITAEATDLNGETQNTTSNIQAGYRSIILSIQTPGDGTITADSLKSINISTRNMMNVFESVKTTLKIFRLKNNNRLLRKRYWDQPDQFTIAEPDYRKMFPWDEYKNENEKEGWAKESRIIELSAFTNEDKPFDLKNIKWQPGWYQAEATNIDKNGEPIQQTVFFEVRSGKNEKPVDPAWFWYSNHTTMQKPGDAILLNIVSDAENIFLIKNSNNTLKNETDWKTINLKKKIEEKIILSNNLNQQYSYTYSFVKQNRFYQFTKNFEVRDNNHLEIKVESFRDKTKPGSEEEWRIRIKDQKGIQNKSEVLTTMYDASLDVFNKNEWLFPTRHQQITFTEDWQTGGFSHIQAYEKSFITAEWAYTEKTYDRLPGLNLFYSFYSMNTNHAVSADISSLQNNKESLVKENNMNSVAVSTKAEQPQIRKNFQETAFFYPQLQTDTSGQVILKFKMPDAITRWNWRVLAHTQDLNSAYIQKEIVTRKELITEPYVPRFLREGDQMVFTVRITNTGNNELSGPCRLELFRKGETESVDGWFQNLFPVQYFSVEPGSSTLVKFPIVAPYYFQDLLTFRVTAVSNMKNGYTVSDGEQGVIPVLSDRLFITETLPVSLKSGESKLINWKSLLASDSSETIRHQSIIAEFTSNPVWAVVQSLPYLAEKSNESVDHLWNRFYANTIASNIANQYPHIKKTINQWQVTDSSALLS
ncbi:MAG: alpha-2-macroglobulin family protein, partial [Bacteroidota bacterium]